MARFAHAGKGAISTARGPDYCGKSFFQHLSCGVTIRQNPVGAYRNVINGSIAACRKVNGSLHIHSDWRLVTCRTKGRRNHRTASICSGLSQCSDVRARPEYRAFRLRGLTPSVPVMQSTPIAPSTAPSHSYLAVAPRCARTLVRFAFSPAAAKKASTSPSNFRSRSRITYR